MAQDTLSPEIKQRLSALAQRAKSEGLTDDIKSQISAIAAEVKGKRVPSIVPPQDMLQVKAPMHTPEYDYAHRYQQPGDDPLSLGHILSQAGDNLATSASSFVRGSNRGLVQGTGSIMQSLGQMLWGQPSYAFSPQGIEQATKQLGGESLPGDDPLAAKLGEGVGGSVPYIEAGMAAGPLGPTATALSGGAVSSLQTYGPTYFDALGRGLSPEQAHTEAIAQSVLAGATGSIQGAIPARLGAALGAVDKATGGGTSRAIARALTDGAVMAGTSAVHAGLANEIRKGIEKMPPEEQKSFLETVTESLQSEGVPQFLVGALFGGVTAALHGQQRAQGASPKERLAATEAQADQDIARVGAEKQARRQFGEQFAADLNRERPVALPERAASLEQAIPLGQGENPPPAQEPAARAPTAPPAVEPSKRFESVPRASLQTLQEPPRSTQPEPIPEIAQPENVQPAASQEAVPYEAKGKSVGERFRQTWVDRLEPIAKRFNEAREMSGRKVSATPLEKETLRRSKTGARLDAERDPVIQGFRERFDSEGISPEEADLFLKARGAALRNARMAEINPDNPGLGSGMSDADAAAIMQRFKADPRYKGFVEIAKFYDRVNKENRRIALESGDRSLEVTQAMEKAYSPEAAAERGLADPENQFESYYTGYRTAPTPEDAVGLGTGTSVSGQPSKRALGRSTEADSPIAFAIMDRQNAIIRSEKLDVQREIANFVDQVGIKDFAYTTDMPTVREFDETSGTVVDRPDRNWRDLPNALPYKTKEGKVRAIIFNKKLAYIPEVLRGESMASPVPYLGAATNFYGRLLTQRNPAFPIFNPMRDVQHTTFMAYAKHGPEFAKDVVAGYAPAYRDINKAMLSHADVPPDVREYLQSGAVVRTMGYQDFAQTVDQIQTSLSEGNTKSAAKYALRWLEHANDAAENATRLSAYRAARKAGKSVQEAALIAKGDVALNFERGGDIKPFINSVFAFSSPGIQGADAVYQLARQSKGNKRIALGLAAIVAGGAALDQINRQLAGEDKNGENYYDQIPENTKHHYWIFMGPDGKYAKVPKFQGLGWFADLGRHGMAYTSGAESKSEAGALVATNLIDASDPLGAGPAEQQITPTLLDPIIQHSTNKSFSGGALAPDTEPKFPGQASKPAHELAWRDTPEPYKAVAKALSEMTQTDLSGRGAVEVRPDIIRHYLRSLGGFGQLADQLVTTASDQRRQGDIPIAGRLLGESSPYFTDRKFRENRQAIADVKARYDQLRKEGRGKDALAWRAENLPLFKAIGRLEMAEKLIAKLPDTPEGEQRKRAFRARFNKSLKEAASVPPPLVEAK